MVARLAMIAGLVGCDVTRELTASSRSATWRCSCPRQCQHVSGGRSDREQMPPSIVDGLLGTAPPSRYGSAACSHIPASVTVSTGLGV